ncbi:hypothetical protein IJ384_07350 [bacterium]|nr:hypothetical protein [bacterium]
MRAIFSNHCGPIFSGSMMNPHLNMHCNPASIFGGTGNFGCGCFNNFSSGFGFGFGFGLGANLGFGIGGFFNNIFSGGIFNGVHWGNTNFMPNFFGNELINTKPFSYNGVIGTTHYNNGISDTQGYDNITIRPKTRPTSNSDKISINSSSSNSEYNSKSRNHTSYNSNLEAKEKIIIDTEKNTTETEVNNNNIEVLKHSIVFKENHVKITNQKDDDLSKVDPKVLKEMKYIAKDALEKYLNTGDLKISDVLVEKGIPRIKGIDISGIFNITKGYKNDYRDEDGNIIRVADGTMITLSFEYEGKIYKYKKRTTKVTKNDNLTIS